MEPRDLDTLTLASLAGSAADRYVLAQLAADGHRVKRSHGFVFQRLLVTQPTIGELAASLGITQQGASKQVVELEELGYVERIPSPHDARVRVVRLTDAGRRVIDAARALRRDFEDELVARFGAASVAAAHDVLALMLDLDGTGDLVRGRAVPLD